jgi:hypothetical protein
MDNSAALLFKCFDQLERQMSADGAYSYKIMVSNDPQLRHLIVSFDNLLQRARHYVFTGLLKQARRLVVALQALSAKIAGILAES